jgi:hypothetical protein
MQRAQIQKVDEQVKFISDQIAQASHIYDLKELCIYVIFKANTRKDIMQKMHDFDQKIYDHNRGFIVNDLNYYQMDAFTNTRCYELPSLQFRKSY